MKSHELTVCGLAAVRAQFAKSAPAIKRLYFDYPTGRRIGVICRALAAARKVYRCVAPEELARISGTLHHGGIVAVIEPPVMDSPQPEEVRRWARAGRPLLLLDGIGNAHNLGAIVRTAAFFGVDILIIPVGPRQAVPGEATYRVAEGGMAYVQFFRVASLPAFIRSLRPCYEVIGTAVRGAPPLGSFSRSGSTGRRPVALVLGNEEHGLTPEVASACSHLVTVLGVGAVESLNVSAAAAILLHHLVGIRRRPRSSTPV